MYHDHSYTCGTVIVHACMHACSRSVEMHVLWSEYMLLAHACIMVIVHSCIMHERIRIVVHTCTMVIACACAIILHACTVTQMRVYHSFFTVHFRT